MWRTAVVSCIVSTNASRRCRLARDKNVFLTFAMRGDPAGIVADKPSNGLRTVACGVLVDLFKTLGKHRAAF